MVYLYSAIPFFIGVASGLQRVRERYDSFTLTALETSPGQLFLITRGMFPASVYAILAVSGYVRASSWSVAAAQALAWGLGTELLLRVAFPVGTAKHGGEKTRRDLGAQQFSGVDQDLFARLGSARMGRQRLEHVQNKTVENTA